MWRCQLRWLMFLRSVLQLSPRFPSASSHLSLLLKRHCSTMLSPQNMPTELGYHISSSSCQHLSHRLRISMASNQNIGRILTLRNIPASPEFDMGPLEPWIIMNLWFLSTQHRLGALTTCSSCLSADRSKSILNLFRKDSTTRYSFARHYDQIWVSGFVASCPFLMELWGGSSGCLDSMLRGSMKWWVSLFFTHKEKLEATLTMLTSWVRHKHFYAPYDVSTLSQRLSRYLCLMRIMLMVTSFSWRIEWRWWGSKGEITEQVLLIKLFGFGKEEQ